MSNLIRSKKAAHNNVTYDSHRQTSKTLYHVLCFSTYDNFQYFSGW